MWKIPINRFFFLLGFAILLKQVSSSNQTFPQKFKLKNSQKESSIDSTINAPECGRRIDSIRGRLPKIVGGNEADPEDWGWQILLRVRGTFNCGGSLINTEWILTAAHCINRNRKPSDYSVRLGLHNRLNPESYSIFRTVISYRIHPKYNRITFENDIALMRLNSPVEFTDQILPICLPTKNTDFSNKMAWATGWGSTGFPDTNTLNEVEIRILTNQECSSHFNSLSVSFNRINSICAGEINGGKDSCQGDSGGPLVANVDDKWQLAGITSWGISCNGAGVYTRTSYFIDWILSEMKNTASISFYSVFWSNKLAIQLITLLFLGLV